MNTSELPLCKAKNYIFIGEAGCGKSEIAINLAYGLRNSGQPIHFFDLDQTKPLFRSRDLRSQMELDGIVFHHEEQFYDAPTLASGIAEALNGEDKTCVLDIGGNDTGSRVLGGFSSMVNRDDSCVYFVVNPYRPWSKTSETLVQTLCSVVYAARVQNVRIICNPNVGYTTTVEEVLEGVRKTTALLEGQLPVECVTVPEDLFHQVKDQIPYPVFPLKLYLRYPWTQV